MNPEQRITEIKTKEDTKEDTWMTIELNYANTKLLGEGKPLFGNSYGKKGLRLMIVAIQ